MYLPPSARNAVATEIADYVRLNTAAYRAVATRVGRAGCPEVAVVAITETGQTNCVAKVAIRCDGLVYVSAVGTHVSRPIRHWSDPGRIVCALLSMEHD